MKFDVLLESLSRVDLKTVEDFADDIFAQLGIDVEFTKHFIDRVNDPRNGKDITVYELIQLFKKTKEKYGKKIASMSSGKEAVLNDLNTQINLPFVIQYDKKSDDFELIAKTVMRKKDFKTRTAKLHV
tara:strand:+ start:193 stop:576 length:384 start_codon:yes stop_codon:yes gene_type:complete